MGMLTARTGKMEIIFSLVFIWMATFFAEGQPLSSCCSEKNVGGVSYTLVEEKDTSAYDCLNNCVYEEAGNPGPRFCMGRGNLTVTCLGKDSDKYCGEDLLSFMDEDPGTPLTHICCNDELKRAKDCTGKDCLTSCGNNTCMKAVEDIQNTAEHCVDGDRDNMGRVDGDGATLGIFLVNQRQCRRWAGSKPPKCPFIAVNGNRRRCACCIILPSYKKKCKSTCRKVCGVFPTTISM